MAREIAGPSRHCFIHLPAEGTRGEVALFWNPDLVAISNPQMHSFSISAVVTVVQSGLAFVLSTVYGLADDGRKAAFLQEISDISPHQGVPWLIAGDFNLIYESNEQQQPTLVKLDRIFCNAAWDALFSPCAVHALSTSHSDHCPLLLAGFSMPPQKARFRFENFWPKHPGFSDVVASTWFEEVSSANPLRRLRVKLGRAARALRRWSKGLFSDARFQLHLALEITLRLDVAQDSRPLTALEFHLRRALKTKVLGLAAVERARRRQASRQIASGFGIHVAHEDKVSALHQHFSDILGASSPRGRDLAWQELHLPSLPAAGIDNPFSLEEIWDAVLDSPAKKAPGPDGFTGTFYRSCWAFIRLDILAAFNHLYHLAGGNFASLNSAFIFLLPKKAQVNSVHDLRLISLIHSFAKLFSKVLARRLAPLMGELISPAQSAFLKTHCIHDNFLFVRNIARALHRQNKPTLLLKLDFPKAFDSVSWEYLLELLSCLGFPARWRDWISMLLSTASSSVLVNGTVGDIILHRRGLRQGDPLSPLLFILAIDPLQRLLLRATELGGLSPLPLLEASMRASLYADDAIIFINPIQQDVRCALNLIDEFGLASGLRINIGKCSVAPIRCSDIDLDNVLLTFAGIREAFPLRYLGLPLSLGRVKAVHLQHIIDRARARLAGWRGRWFNAGGRRALSNSVLGALPVFAMTALKLPKNFISSFDKIRRHFLWGVDDDATAGGKCKINWIKVCSPLDFGGLGLANLSSFGRALRLRWLWLEWRAPERPSVGTATPCDEIDRDLFAAATRVSVGDGKMAIFWHSNWIGGLPLRLTFPLLFARSRRKSWSVADALRGHLWIRDLRHDRSEVFLLEFVLAWRELAMVTLQPDAPDSIKWILTTAAPTLRAPPTSSNSRVASPRQCPRQSGAFGLRRRPSSSPG
ncbi:uncharacterized protein LOC104585565 [Brachypodium distachyon]|uniref:uncharacterized protein LOC104585565 n=1 Tax=Brachypodium distachyon TaxID=15368 RepID=UPI00052FF599|nr:uncharacterized protein LOC104585565 [Brachypodium distachyon]|eukprot:XP_010240795.1 uncharacterized protein LOC104585565 [Brachypodium distachyon]